GPLLMGAPQSRYLAFGPTRCASPCAVPATSHSRKRGPSCVLSSIGATVESMAYRLLADLVVGVHLVYLAFVAVGGALAWRWRRLVWPHLAALTVAFVSVTVGFDCPLTNVEKWLRRRAGDRPYHGGFIDHYIVGTLVPR